VYEHVTCGGFCDQPISASILSEGFSMLRTITADFGKAGHEVTTQLDSRIAAFDPPLEANHKIVVSSLAETKKSMRKISSNVDATYIIAPETNHVLSTLVKNVEQSHALSLNCSPIIIEKTANKMAFLEHVKKSGLSTPETISGNTIADAAETLKVIRRRLNFPLIFKPLDGTSCSGIRVVQNEAQIPATVDKMRMNSSKDEFLIQEMIRGIPVSVSLVSTGNKIVPISLNGQIICLRSFASNSAYIGGIVPFDSDLKNEAFEEAEKCINSLGNLRGYVGVDLILTDKKPVIIEVNPRLTTSFLGVRTVINFNLAQSLIDIFLEQKLPENILTEGSAFFSKVKTGRFNLNGIKELYSKGEILAPPFPISLQNFGCALILTKGNTPEEARSKFFGVKEGIMDQSTGVEDFD
jgi:predicted ATP-grasp superfamily ATP-dependent carboligase